MSAFSGVVRHRAPPLVAWGASRVVVRQRLSIAADVRLDYKSDLVSRLGLSSVDGYSLQDEELILRAYERWGDGCVERLEGDFAFALWDADRRALLCARDPFGIRPFAFHAARDRFWFASRIPDVIAQSGVTPTLRDDAVAHYLAGGAPQRDGTLFNEIRRLPPGHRLIVERGSTRLERTWSASENGEPVRPASSGTAESESVATFRKLFRSAVRSRLTVRPCGALLSGGLDSSSIACVAREFLEEDGASPLTVLSLRFPGLPQCDEGPWIREVVKAGRLVPVEVDATQIDPLGDLETTLEDAGEPSSAVNLHLSCALYRTAAEHGIEVLLDGLDGDTTISHGLHVLADLWRTGRWIELSREVGWLSRRFKTSPWRLLWRRVLCPSLPAAMPADGLGDSLETAHHRGRLESGHLPRAFEAAHFAAERWGVEPRYPFMDRRLVELCLGLAPRLKLRCGWTRWILRAAMEGTLPEAVRWRERKADIAEAMRRGLLRRQAEALADLAADPDGPTTAWVEPSVVARALERCRRGAAHGDTAFLTRVLFLDAWLRGRPAYAAHQYGKEGALWRNETIALSGKP